MKLFKVDSDTGNISFVREELKTIKEFNELIRRDRGGVIKGDPDGRLKFRATAELGVIWWCNDPYSPGVQKGLNEKELLEEARVNYGLPDTWKPDSIFLAAQERYRKERSSVAQETYVEILRAFRVLYKYIKFARQSIEKNLDSTDLTPEEWKALEPKISAIIKLADEIPSRIKAIQVAKELLDKEENKSNLLRGSKEEIPDSMIPGKDPE